jgi:hypothetical protein
LTEPVTDGLRKNHRWAPIAIVAFLGLAIIGFLFLDRAPTISSRSKGPSESAALKSEGTGEKAMQAVSRYFDALGEANAAGRRASSMGDLRAWASWVDRIPHGKLLPPELEIDRFYLLRDRNESASVAFEAEVASIGDGAYRYHGPVAVVGTDQGWKVKNYFRNGRSQEEAIFDEMSGDVHSALPLRMRLLGAVLQDDYTNLFVEVRNASSARILLSRPWLGRAGDGAKGFIAPTSLPGDDRRILSLFWRESLPLETSAMRATLYGKRLDDPHQHPIRLDLTLQS